MPDATENPSADRVPRHAAASRPQLEYGVAPPSYRLPADVELGAVRLVVSDLARSAAFYRDVLGLRAMGEGEGRLTLGTADGSRVLVELREQPGVRAVPRGGLLGLYHFAVLLPDRPALGRFVRHLAGRGMRAGMADHLVSEAVYLQDPDNLGIEVYADRARESWRHRDRELLMASDPLDVADLAAAGGDERWTGAPAGTRIGHVHLHVGELARASRFYHDAVGFDRVVWSYPGALFLSAGGYHHHLGVNVWARQAVSAGPADARLEEWELRFPDAESLAQARASLVASGQEPVAVGEDAVTVRDPWGTQLRLTVRSAPGRDRRGAP